MLFKKLAILCSPLFFTVPFKLEVEPAAKKKLEIQSILVQVVVDSI